MKKIVLSLVFVFSVIVSYANILDTKTVSDASQFYLITCKPGDEIYARFGHSGLLVYDPINDIDAVFHWGLFSFDTPNFVGRFISGETDYQMGVFSTKYFMKEYIKRGSSVYAQELDLTFEQKNRLWEKLLLNYQKENRTYRYNFIYDNCATRPYQLILSAYDYKVALNSDNKQITYRDIINEYVPVGSLFNTGINLIIGAQADKMISPKESAAFPLYTMNTLSCTQYIGEEGTTNPIVKQQQTIHKASQKKFEVSNSIFYTSIVIPLLLALCCGFYTYRKRRFIPYLSQLILICSAIIGCIISYLWFFSHHPLVGDNMNILWCNPLNIILAIVLFFHRKSLKRTKAILAFTTFILSLSFIVVLIFNLQTTTIHIFAIWVLVFTINTTILYTYKSYLRKITTTKQR